MAQIGWLSDSGQQVSFADALAISETEGSWNSIPHEVLVLIHKQVTKERPDGISVTQLLGCLRKVYLEGTNDWYSMPIENWPALRGTIVHNLLETTGGERAEVEVRHERVHNGITISGQPDSVRVLGKGKRRLIRDWKSTNKLPFYDNAYSSHKLQTNIYRWLLELDPRFTEIEIVYISMDGVKAIPLKKGGLTKYGRQIENQVMTDEQVEAFLDSRLVPLNEQFANSKPIPYHKVDEGDLWNCQFCPVKNICYSLAADEAQEAWSNGESIDRVPPRERKAK
jgi:CRISPR/Cas system-associated exonuclease Cas4 (RecB family)